MDICIDEAVDFLLITGDLFQVGIPDLGAVNDAVKKMRELFDADNGDAGLNLVLAASIAGR